jgi:hypothetical protein
MNPARSAPTREPPFVRHDDHGDSRFSEMNVLPEMLAA